MWRFAKPVTGFWETRRISEALILVWVLCVRSERIRYGLTVRSGLMIWPRIFAQSDDTFTYCYNLRGGCAANAHIKYHKLRVLRYLVDAEMSAAFQSAGVVGVVVCAALQLFGPLDGCANAHNTHIHRNTQPLCDAIWAAWKGNVSTRQRRRHDGNCLFDIMDIVYIKFGMAVSVVGKCKKQAYNVSSTLVLFEIARP